MGDFINRHGQRNAFQSILSEAENRAILKKVNF